MSSPSSVGAHIDVLVAGTAEINRWVNENPRDSLDLRYAQISDSELSGALLQRADLEGAVFRNCKFLDADFDYANLTNAQFIKCNLSNSKIRSSDITTACLKNSILDGADFTGTRGISQTQGIETSIISNKQTDVYFDLSFCRWLDRFVSWGKIRTIGQLRLFVPSYAALLISILALTSLSFLNEHLAIIRGLIVSLIDKGVLTSEIGTKIIKALHSWPSSWRHLAVLASTLGLALGATLYLFCPPRVKEFTIDEWKYLAGRPAFEYHVQTWALPSVRCWCAACYVVGATIAAVLLGDTLIRAVTFVIGGLNS